MLAAAIALPLAANMPHIVEWDSAEPVELEVSIEPGNIAEVCSKLVRHQAVAWSFASSQSVDFSIHYHVGREVVYPMKRFKIARSEGRLEPEIDQTYCWMWSNRRETATKVSVKLARRP